MLETTIIMRNVSRNKLLLCFRPVVVDMDQLVLDSINIGGGADRSKKHLSMESKEDNMKRSASCSSLSENNRCSSSENSLILHSPKKNLSRVIKAVFLGTILSKRVRDGKAVCQDSNRSKHISSMNSKKSLDADEINNLINIESNSVTSCSSSSSIGPSSTSLSRSKSEPNNLSSLMKNSKDPNQEFQVKPKRIMDNNSAIYFLLICLMATVLCGKTYAIIITSIWLYFLHRGRLVIMNKIINSSRPEKITTWLPEKKEAIEYYYYKKKVIMEGLLERNHQRVGAGIKFLT